MYTRYDLLEHGAMLQDNERVQSYVRALSRIVKPDSAVLDIGTGLGFFALVASRLGANKVVGIDTDAIVMMAEAVAATNGIRQKPKFIRGASQDLNSGEFDIIVSDLRGVLPMFENHIRTIIDARTRLLCGSGFLVPRADRLYVALINDARTYAAFSTPWASSVYGVDLRGILPFSLNRWLKVNAYSSQLITPPATWGRIDYMTVATEDVAGEACWILEYDATAHGLLVWFEAELADGIFYTSGPGNPGSVYGQAFFPFAKPIELERNAEAKISLSARKAGDGYAWEWGLKITDKAHGYACTRKYLQASSPESQVPG